MAWYSENPYEAHTTLHNRPFGPYAHTYWMMLTCNVFGAQVILAPVRSIERSSARIYFHHCKYWDVGLSDM